MVRYTAVQDAGRAVHPAYVEGQIQGGAAQGIGWALNEEYVFDKSGEMANPGFLDYRMPVASDLPMIDAVIVEVPNPTHPYGVRGVGETPIVVPLAAVANAMRDATGVRFESLPLSPAPHPGGARTRGRRRPVGRRGRGSVLRGGRALPGGRLDRIHPTWGMDSAAERAISSGNPCLEERLGHLGDHDAHFRGLLDVSGAR